MKRWVITVVGRVQGVGFRYFARSAAAEYGISGWVVNRADGTVVLDVDGEPEKLDAFLAAIKQGPRLAEVYEARVEERAEQAGHVGFRVG